MESEDKKKEAARYLQSLRRKKSGGRKGGRPRTIEHTGEAGCRCMDCRVAKGWVPGRVAETGKVAEVESGYVAPWGEVGPEEIPEGMVLASDVAGQTEGRATEEDVWTRAVMMAKEARPRKLGDGRRVVAKEWADGRLKNREGGR